MKRLLSVILALALLSPMAANADPFGRGPHGGYNTHYDGGWRHHGHHDDGAGTAVAVGFGLLALTAIIAASDQDREEARERAYAPPPPRYQDRYDQDRYAPEGRDYDQGMRNYSDDRPPYDNGYGPDQQ
jgi:hypothetical protein